MERLSQVILILLLIALNAFFVASEFALIALRKTRVEELVKKGNPVAHLLLRALERIDIFIGATQLGVTFISLILGWIGEPIIASFIGSLFFFLPQGQTNVIVHTISIIIALFLITYLEIVLGELVPKTISLRKTELVAFIIIAPLTVFAHVFRPFIHILNKSASWVLKFLKFIPPAEGQVIYSTEEISLILDQLKKNGSMPKNEVEIVNNAFRLREVPIKRLMIPRTDITAFPSSLSINELHQKINDHPHSRFPIYEGSIDNIIGFIHVKDVYKLLLKRQGKKMLKETKLIRRAFCVPETKKANEVLLDMRKKHVHMVVLDDEFGGTSGIVTLEDIIESLVGDIQDEFDQAIKTVQRQSDGSYLLDGRMDFDLAQKRFNLSFGGQSYSTVGGFVFGLLGREPKLKDRVQLGNIVFEVEEMIGKRIKMIRLKREVKNKE